MRIDLSYKFIFGFLLVVGSVVLMGQLVPHLGIQPEFQQLFSIACAIVIGLVIGVTFSRTLTANFRRVNDGAERLSRGDLSTGIALRQPFFADETVDLAAALNSVASGLRELVGHIRGNSESVAVSAHGLSFTALDMSNSAQEVAAKVEQIAWGVEHQEEMVAKANKLIREVAVLAELVTASAHKLAISADETAVSAQNGGELAAQTTETLRKALREIESDAQRMAAFSNQLREVGMFVEMITRIANRTNLLSFTAQAKADQNGPQSGEFAEISDELHKLADSTNDFTAEITLLLETVSNENQNLLDSMNAIVSRVTEGEAALDVTGRAFSEIIGSATTTRTKANSIAELAHQQGDGVKGIVAAMEEILGATAENAAAASEAALATGRQTAAMADMAQAANYLNHVAEELSREVARFQLEAPSTETAEQRVSEPSLATA